MQRRQFLVVLLQCCFFFFANGAGSSHGAHDASTHEQNGIETRGKHTDAMLAVFFVLALGAVMRLVNRYVQILPYTSLIFIVAYLMGIWFKLGVRPLLCSSIV